MDERGTSSPDGGRTAVVAVHGIGQQKPGDSVRAIAGLLLRLRTADQRPRYASFREVPLQVPVQRVGVKPRTEPPPEPSQWWHALSPAFQAQLGATRDPRYFATDYEFMRAQLAEYPGTEEPYVTTRVEGVRGLSTDPHASRIHVYEVYWEDLSRLGEGGLRLVGNFYQLLFDAANLGKVAVDQAALKYQHQPWWMRYWRAHAFTVDLFTILVPLTWLLMLGTSLTLPLLQVPTPGKLVTLSMLGGIIAFGGLWFLLVRLRAKRPRLSLRWAWGVGIGAIAASYAVAAWLEGWTTLAVDLVVAISWFATMGALTWWLFRTYDKVRPGAARIGRLTVALLLAASVPWLLGATSPDDLMGRVVDTFAVETIATVVIWHVMYASGSLAALVGLQARRALPRGEGRRRLRRTLWTAAATLGIATSVVLVFTFVLWSGILATSRGFLRPLEVHHFHITFPWMRLGDVADEDRIGYYLEQLLQGSAGAGYPLLLWCMLIALLTAAIVLAPSLRAELFPRANDSAEASQRMGQHLSAGLRVMAGTAVGLFISTFGLQPITSILHWIHEYTGALQPISGALELLHVNGARWIAWSGGLLTASGVGLLVLRGRVGPVVDTALDVDNYMREHPRDGTPRARICERYASLLRYLNTWRDEQGRPYDRVVIVAHSQGTAITADLLGFARMEREANPGLFPLLDGPAGHHADRQLSLFTMGSPLRQVYWRAFPMLFEWMSGVHRPWGDSDRQASARVPALDAGPSNSLGDDVAPHPHDFGLWRWVNAYRSGDYVGRELWRNDHSHAAVMYAPGVVSADRAGFRREVCIGSGAHTRYWDATAPMVAEELDQLIARGYS
jgi:hypothetical protein